VDHDYGNSVGIERLCEVEACIAPALFDIHYTADAHEKIVDATK
jgi:hypothetical protein